MWWSAQSWLVRSDGAFIKSAGVALTLFLLLHPRLLDNALTPVCALQPAGPAFCSLACSRNGSSENSLILEKMLSCTRVTHLMAPDTLMPNIRLTDPEVFADLMINASDRVDLSISRKSGSKILGLGFQPDADFACFVHCFPA